MLNLEIKNRTRAALLASVLMHLLVLLSIRFLMRATPLLHPEQLLVFEIHETHDHGSAPKLQHTKQSVRKLTAAQIPHTHDLVSPQEPTVSEMPTQNAVVLPHPSLSDDHGPQVIHSVLPKLPRELKEEDISTSVLVEVTVSEKGQSQVHLLQSSGRSELDTLALNSLRNWVFAPAQTAGRFVDSRMRLRIQFEVN